MTASDPVDGDCVPAPAGLVSWWPGEGSADDIAGTNDGALINGATFAAGMVGQAFSFDGVDDHVRVPDAADLKPAHVTVEAWVRASNPGTFRYVVTKGAPTSGGSPYALYTGTTGGLSFYVHNHTPAPTDNVQSPVAGPGIWDGNWHHVVGTYDQTRVRLYVDGAEIGTGTPTTHSINYNVNGTHDLLVGGLENILGFPGQIDEVSVYDRALNAAEIQDIYNAGSEGKCTEVSPPAANVGTALYVAGQNSDTLHKYDTATGAPEFAPASINAPYGVTVGPDGMVVYVGNQATDSVERFDAVSGASLGTFVSTASGGLDGPVGMTFGADGNLYVASYLTDEVLRYDGATGGFLDVFANGGGIQGPAGLTFGPDGKLYVTDRGHSADHRNILRYDGATGAFIDVFATGTGNSAEQIVFGPDGDLYVAEYYEDRIARFDGDTGARLADFASGGPLAGPVGLAFGPDGRLYVSAYDANTVLRYDFATGALLDTFIPAGEIISPAHLAFGPSNPGGGSDNAPPVAHAGGPYTVNEGGSVLLDGTGSSDPDQAASSLIYEWDLDGDGVFDVTGATPTFSAAGLNGPSQVTVTLRVTDNSGETSTATAMVNIMNVAPTVLADVASILVDEGVTAANTGTFSDSGGDAVTLSASIGAVTNNGDGTWSWSFVTTDGPDESQLVTITAADSDGAVNSTSFALMVHNVAPTVGDASFAIDENSPNGTLVGNVAANDPGADTLIYSLTGGTGAAAFAIHPQTGAITVADSAQLDFETTTSFTLVVTVTDDDGATGVADVTIDLLNLASISGSVFVDTNQNGLFEANEMGIDGVLVELLDELGSPVLDEFGAAIQATTSLGGSYLFEDLAPGVYQLSELQPTGVTDGPDFLGSLGGTLVANDTMQLALERTDATDYVFSEFGQQVTSGDAATIGFWQNRHGQDLIRQGGSALAGWLTANFGNVFGNAFGGGDGEDVARFYRDQLFKQTGKKMAGPAKVDAQFMAVALATYFTSRNLAGESAGGYGFHVTDTGIGTKIVNVGTSGAAFDVGDHSDRTILQLLLATNSLTDMPDHLSGFAHIYDRNGDGIIDASEATLRSMANGVYSMINEQGGI